MKASKVVLSRRKSEFDHMTDEEYFLRPSFIKYLMGVLRAVVTASKSRNIKLSVYASDDGSTAATNGMIVQANVLSPLVIFFKTRKDKFLALVGSLCHECFHLLFTDFDAIGEFRDSFETGILPSYITNPDIREVWKKMTEKGKAFQRYCLGYMSQFQNIFEDGFIERRGKNFFPGIPRMSINHMRKAAWATMPELNEVFEKPSANLLEALVVGFLCFITKGRVKGASSTAKEHPDEFREFNEAYLKVSPFAETLLDEQRGKYRNTKLYFVFTELYPLFESQWEEALEEARKNAAEADGEGSELDGSETSGGSGSQDKSDDEMSTPTRTGTSSGSSEEEPSGSEPESESGTAEPSGPETPSEDQIAEAIAEALAEELAKSGMAPIPEGAEGKAYGISSGASFEPVPAFDDAEETALAELEAERREEWQEKFAEEADDMSVNLIFKTEDISIAEINSYNACLKEVEPIAKKTVRLLNTVFMERNREGEINGELIGKRLDTRTLYRKDGRNFKRELIPDGSPDCCFAIRVDESGSMSWTDPQHMARKAAICLESICRKLDVPVAIYGDTADELEGGDVSILNYVDFDSFRADDRYRLARIRDRANNHDGAALLYGGNLLKPRHEKNRVLIVISDGRPLAENFSGYSAIRKCTEIVDRLEKQGIVVFAAALGDSYPYIKEIYGERRVLDISDVNRLPAELTKLVRRYCLKR